MNSINHILDFSYFDYAALCSGYMDDMQHLFDQCQQMMDVTDEEIETYCKARQQIEVSMKGADAESSLKMKELMQLQKEIDKARNYQ